MPGAENYDPAVVKMAKQPEDDALDATRGTSMDMAPSPDEATGLLGAGARARTYSASDSDAGDEAPSRKDSWVGDKEYAHLPWYRKPHVRVGARRPRPMLHRILTVNLSRSSGLSRPMRSSLWHLAVP